LSKHGPRCWNKRYLFGYGRGVWCCPPFSIMS
jgi:hypothetical protein